jgi:hypothetical protein
MASNPPFALKDFLANGGAAIQGQCLQFTLPMKGALEKAVISLKNKANKATAVIFSSMLGRYLENNPEKRRQFEKACLEPSEILDTAIAKINAGGEQKKQIEAALAGDIDGIWMVVEDFMKERLEAKQQEVKDQIIDKANAKITAAATALGNDGMDEEKQEQEDDGEAQHEGAQIEDAPAASKTDDVRGAIEVPPTPLSGPNRSGPPVPKPRDASNPGPPLPKASGPPVGSAIAPPGPHVPGTKGAGLDGMER